ncbi:MAG: hypothetical protein IJJ82_04890 [Clostridia bacterium]|nr:hypothetical protein [Clostridia bacterium]
MNNLNKKIKISIIILILLIIMVCVLIIINNITKKEEENEFFNNHPTISERKPMNSEITTNEYYIVKECVQKYYNTIYSIGHEVIHNTSIDKSVYIENNANVLLNILNEGYLDECEVNKEKIIEEYKNFEYNNYIIKDIYSAELENNFGVFVIYGKQINDFTNKSEESNLIILLDNTNNTYSIVPYEGMIKMGFNTDVPSEDDIYNSFNLSRIKNKQQNIFEFVEVDNKTIVEEILNDFKHISKYYKSESYDLVDEEYRNKHFANREVGEKYLNENIYDIFGDKITKMAIDESDPYYTRYICLDNNGNYFIIKKDDQLMKYSIILDIYTIPVKEVTEKYNNSNNAQKTAINIEKFKQMINLKDYNSAYNVLDETFRNNNFKSVENFEKYVKQKWPEFIDIKCSDYKEVNDVGTMKVKISARGTSNTENNKVIEKTFIVKLLDDNNFVMSFNVNE